MTIKQYALIVEHTPEKIVSTITAAIAKGWAPIGGISIAHNPANPKLNRPVGSMAYAQAMVLPYRPEDAFAVPAAQLAEKIANGAGN